MKCPDAFATYRQFVLHRNKVPINPHTLAAFPKGGDWQHDPASWTDYATADMLATKHGMGIAFLLTAEDPFFFVDLDKCLVDGQWSKVACDVLAMFPGCAVEVSTSGTGLHVFGTGIAPPGHANKNTQLGLEFYTQERIAILTGTHKSGDAATVCNLVPFVTEYMTREASTQSQGWTTEPVEDYHPLTDEQLLKRAMRSGSVGSMFEDRATFADLWERNERILAKSYPPSTGEASFDRSSADAALAQHLAFWTGRNCERVKALMWQSELVRDKYERDDYLERTIEGAVNRCTEVYRGPDKRREQQQAENAELGESFPSRPTTPLMDLDQMLKGLVFIGGEHAVGNFETKTLRKKAAAADEYAASRHTFIDPDTRQEKSTQSFKAWISHPARVSVESATWRPGAPDVCRPPEGHGAAFNTWRGFVPLESPDDWQVRVQPWLDHIKWLCGEDADDFMRWLAHIVQRPEALPHTCYLHVTPTTGIGRNWMSGVLCRVLRGYVAAGVDLGKVLDGSFNGRLSQKLLAVVDEVREGGDWSKQHTRAEKLKSTITEELRHIDPKYGVQTIEHNCCRWLMFSQHLDALPFENSDRRVNVILNPTKRQTPEYYAQLYALLHDTAFIGSVWQYLSSLDLDGFNPSAPAPASDAKRLALDTMASEVDFAVSEFVEKWPADVAALDQVREFVGNECSIPHLRHALQRLDLRILAKAVKLPTGMRSRVVVLRGSPAGWEMRPDLKDICIEAGIKAKVDELL